VPQPGDTRRNYRPKVYINCNTSSDATKPPERISQVNPIKTALACRTHLPLKGAG
jgi:hypothetical protein